MGASDSSDSTVPVDHYGRGQAAGKLLLIY